MREPREDRTGAIWNRIDERAVGETATGAKRAIAACIRQTAGLLGNTPTVCRASYVHPAVIDCYAEGTLAHRLARPDLDEAERALLKLLRQIERAPAA